MTRPIALAIAVVFATGCGGKILVEDSTGGGADPRGVASSDRASPREGEADSPDPEEPPSRPSATGGGPTLCERLCLRDERCPTTLPAVPRIDGAPVDCVVRCEGFLRDGCGASEWMECYAGELSREAGGCAPIPAECRAAHCDWLACTRGGTSALPGFCR